MSNYLIHVGNENSGRYPRGSGDRPNQHRTNKAILAERKKDLANRRSLSDEEIQKRIDRMNLEKKYKDLAMEDINPGKKAANEILSETGKKVLKTAAVGVGLYLVKTALEAGTGNAKSGMKGWKAFGNAFKESFNPKEFGSSVFNGGPKKK